MMWRWRISTSCRNRTARHAVNKDESLAVAVLAPAGDVRIPMSSQRGVSTA
jgi:hypothetical protein